MAGNQNWRTPNEFFDGVNDFVGGFDIDVCASNDNAKCEKYFTIEEDALKQDWEGLCWCNPPYSNIKPFMQQAISQAYGNDVETFMLIPANFDTKYYHELVFDMVEFVEAVYVVKGRLRFLGENNEPLGTPKFPSVVIHYKHSPETPINFYTCSRDFKTIKKVS